VKTGLIRVINMNSRYGGSYGFFFTKNKILHICWLSGTILKDVGNSCLAYGPRTISEFLNNQILNFYEVTPCP